MKRRSEDPDDEASGAPIGHVIGIGGFGGVVLRFLRKFQLPAIALRDRSLYRVMLEGRGFELPVGPSDASEPNPTGFFTTRFVAARTRAEAEALAKAHVIREWQGFSLLSHFTGVDEPTLQVSESEAIDGWFRHSKGGGFSFYSGTDQEPPA